MTTPPAMAELGGAQRCLGRIGRGADTVELRDCIRLESAGRDSVALDSVIVSLVALGRSYVMQSELGVGQAGREAGVPLSTEYSGPSLPGS